MKTITDTYFLDDTISIFRDDYLTYYQYLKIIKAAKRHYSFWEVVTGGMRFWMYGG